MLLIPKVSILSEQIYFFFFFYNMLVCIGLAKTCDFLLYLYTKYIPAKKLI